MVKIINLDEMQEILKDLGDPTAEIFALQLMDLGDAMAERLIEVLQAKGIDIDCRPTSCDGTAFAGTCAAFFPTKPDQPVPEALIPYDEEGDWEPRVQLTAPPTDGAGETQGDSPSH